MSPIAITGMHRSGTSMVAKTLRLRGLYLGSDDDLLAAAPDNPEGFFEHEGLVRLNDDLLEATGGAWDHPPVCAPLALQDPRVEPFAERADELVAKLSGRDTWGWKDPRTCLTARFWTDLLPELRVVICVRHPLEVALSVKRRNQMSYTHALWLWQEYYEMVLSVVAEDRRIVTHYDASFRDPLHEAERLAAFAGIPASGGADARDGLNRNLRHHQIGISLEDAKVPPRLALLYERLCHEAGFEHETGRAAGAQVTIESAKLDLALAQQLLEGRSQQLDRLERERASLAARLAELEASPGADRLAGLHTRLAKVEDAVHDLRYRVDPIEGRPDADVIRGCRQLVRDHVPSEAKLLVIGKSDPVMLDLYGRTVGNFPQDDAGCYPGFAPARSISAIAHLEALRRDGADFLLVPQTSAWWYDFFPDFAEHLRARYGLVADQPGVGVLYRLARSGPAGQWPTSLARCIDRLAGRAGRDLAILDLTTSDLVAKLRGRSVFVPPRSDAPELPYLDGTVDLVVLDDERDRAEAARVAATAVLHVEGGSASTPRVRTVEMTKETSLDAAAWSLLLTVDVADPDPLWLAAVHEALDDVSMSGVLLAPDAATLADAAAGADAVLVLESGVLPLPGTVSAARAALADDAVGAVAAKLLRRDGVLEAAGLTVFADGSWAPVGSALLDVEAPWHEYVRSTCGGAGLLFVRGSIVDRLARRREVSGSSPLVAWGGWLWRSGCRVVYQPDAVAVRTEVEHPPDADAVAAAWRPLLEQRPARRDVLDDLTWRAVTALDDMCVVGR